MPKSFNVPSSGLRKNNRVLLVALGLVLTLCGFFLQEVVRLQNSMADLRTNDVARIEVRNVLVDLLDAETGQRGFLLTGDEKYLEPYYRGRQHARQSLHRAEQTDLDDVRFRTDLVKLAILIENKFEELERTVLLKKRGDAANALKVVTSGYGKEAMDEARALIQRQLSLLRGARDDIMSDVDTQYARSAIFLVLMLSAVVALTVHAWKSLSKSARHNTDLARHLAREASHDALTELPNRRFFDRWAKQLLTKSKREGKPLTLMLIDLDGFKKVNDTHGHAIGDEVLKAAAARFQSTLREGEFLARLGGDEFGVLIEGAPTRSDLARLARRLIKSLSEQLHPQLTHNAVGASIGVACFPKNGTDVDSLTEAADKALYDSKDGGRGIVSFSSSGRVVELRSVPLV